VTGICEMMCELDKVMSGRGHRSDATHW